MIASAATTILAATIFAATATVPVAFAHRVALYHYGSAEGSPTDATDAAYGSAYGAAYGSARPAYGDFRTADEAAASYGDAATPGAPERRPSWETYAAIALAENRDSYVAVEKMDFICARLGAEGFECLSTWPSGALIRNPYFEVGVAASSSSATASRSLTETTDAEGGAPDPVAAEILSALDRVVSATRVATRPQFEWVVQPSTTLLVS